MWTLLPGGWKIIKGFPMKQQEGPEWHITCSLSPSLQTGLTKYAGEEIQTVRPQSQPHKDGQDFTLELKVYISIDIILAH